MSTMIGRHIDNYEILSLLGEGGMASVYRARQTRMNRDVAIKVIESKLARNEDFLRRFEREAQIVAALSHPHILKVFDYGKYEDTVYLVMELLRGGSLAEQIRRGALTPDKAGRVLEQIASALDYAHRQGIIHRDLKPQNVLLDTEGNAHLTDFGIAKLLSETSALTQSGVAMGTPAYMSPEQWQGQSLDNRADIYALGIMLFEMLSGRLPYLADTPFSMMHMHVNVPSPAIRELRADLPPGIEGVIQKALSKTREGRFNTAGELSTAFKNALVGGTPIMVTNAAPLPPNEDTLAQARSTPAAPTASPPSVPSGGGGRSIYIGIALVIILLLVGGAAIILSGGQSKTTATPTTFNTQILVLPTFTATARPPEKSAQAITLTLATPNFTPTEGSTLDIVYVAQTVDARETAAAHLTALAITQTQGATRILTATPTPTPSLTPNITASLDAFRTNRAATATSDYHANETATAILSVPTFTSKATAFPTLTANSQWTPVVGQFDGVTMLLVPPGCFQMGSHDGGTDEEPVHQQCFTTPFLIDQTEVTQGQFKQFGGVAAKSSSYRGDNRPVENITWDEARDFCAMRGGRLPTEAEWEYAARGPDSLTYPWGNNFDGTKVVYGRGSNVGTVVVGSHPIAASWVNTLDMSGNVWEWVSSIYKPYPYNKDDGRESDGDANSRRVLRGGSWSVTAEGLLRASFRARGVPSSQVSSNGFRCARDFSESFTALVPTATVSNASTSIPVVGANNQWTPIVQNIDAVAMVIVPPGCFQMGSHDGSNDEEPVNKQCFDAPFLIDQTEVTQGQFKQFGGMAAKSSSYRGNNRPVENNTWDEARDFCAKRGGRLPTEAEWEYAARGPDSLTYPWGNSFDSTRLAYHRGSNAGTELVGNHPMGASWVGALDMSGNVWEWVSSIYKPYPYNKDDGRESDGDANSRRVLRGGSWSVTAEGLFRASFRARDVPFSQVSNNGFRCARDL